jgi:aspartyl-tRNA(Asn)/glutamyl-tRNA(Gln) amidotransferase subunit B
VLDAGGTLLQETRGWVEAQGRTISQRSKEQAHDYRYFPEPDLPPLRLDSAFVERVRATLPELPDARAARFRSQYGLTAYDAAVLTDTRESAEVYEALVALGVPAKLAANWLNGDVAALANEHRVPLAQSGLGIAGLTALLRLVDGGAINGPTAKELLVELYVSGGDPEALVRERGLAQVSDPGALTALVEAAIATNPGAADDFRAGREQALGQLMRAVKDASGGKADMPLVNQLLRDRLSRQ